MRLSCACCRAIYDLYQNLYDTWFRGQSQETIAKVKAFYQTQVSNGNTTIDFFIKCWLAIIFYVCLIPRPPPFYTLRFVFTWKQKSCKKLWTQTKEWKKKQLRMRLQCQRFGTRAGRWTMSYSQAPPQRQYLGWRTGNEAAVYMQIWSYSPNCRRYMYLGTEFLTHMHFEQFGILQVSRIV